MTIGAASMIMGVLGAYFAIGAVAGLVFVLFGAPRIDPAARGMPIRARLLVWPGAIALWPLMLVKWIGGQTPPVT